MPVLHTQFSGEGKAPDGKVVKLSSAFVMASRGPVLQAAITVAEQVAAELVKQGKPVQPPVAGFALIDTGAYMTCVDEDAAKQLQLPVVDVVNMSSASHASHPANVIRLELGSLASRFR